jgi:O-antigen/teichoic acid export membrane protein
MGSIITFGLNMWLIRNGEATSYGVYVFWFSVAWVLGSCQGTLVSTHLFNIPSEGDDVITRRDPERLLFSVTLILVVVVGLGVLAGNLALGATGSNLAEPTACGFIPAFLLYQYARAFAFARGKVTLATVLTGSVLLICFTGLGLDRFAGHLPTAARVLAIVGFGYGVSAIAILAVLLNGRTPMVRLSELRPYVRYLRGAGWMMLGAASGEAISRLYSFAVVGQFGTDALAKLSAVQTIIRPAWMLSAAWTSIGYPTITTKRAANDRRGVVVTMAQGATATLMGSTIWSVIVILAWPFIAKTLYLGRYEDAVGIAYLWAGNVMLGSVGLALNIGLLALSEFRRLALVDLAGAAVCASSLLLLGHLDYPFAIVATMAGQVTQIALMVAVLTSRLRSSAPIAA